MQATYKGTNQSSFFLTLIDPDASFANSMREFHILDLAVPLEFVFSSGRF